jgi:Spy/CpxP family protein refolding chaperone
MNNLWKVILAFIVVFLAGAICGRPVLNRLLEPPHVSMMDRFTKQLSLTPIQQEKIRPIVLQAQQETQRLRKENMKAFMEVMDRTHAAISAELTPEQRVKQDAMRKRFQEHLDKVRAGLREHGSGPPN